MNHPSADGKSTRLMIDWTIMTDIHNGIYAWNLTIMTPGLAKEGSGAVQWQAVIPKMDMAEYINF